MPIEHEDEDIGGEDPNGDSGGYLGPWGRRAPARGEFDADDPATLRNHLRGLPRLLGGTCAEAQRAEGVRDRFHDLCQAEIARLKKDGRPWSVMKVQKLWAFWSNTYTVKQWLIDTNLRAKIEKASGIRMPQ